MDIKLMTERSGKDTPKATKLEIILRQLVNGKSLNRFEAEHHHDHCLNSTISIQVTRPATPAVWLKVWLKINV